MSFISINRVKSVNPTGSYVISLPAGVCEDKDNRVASYWLPGKEVLLQVSSYVRTEGKQVAAKERLKNRMAEESLAAVKLENMPVPSCPDCAAMSGIDEQGGRWYFCYAVWPDLTILLTISGSPDELLKHGAWAFDGLKSIALAKSDGS
jgi:hypothetical protein